MSSQLAGESTTEQPDVAALYQRHGDTMHRVAGADLAGTGVDPRDAVACVINDLVSKHKRGTLHGVDNWEAYLVRSVRNAAARLAGRAAREHLVEDADLVYLADRTPVAGHDNTVITRMEAQRRLDRLDPRKRAIIEGLYITELTRAELAEQFGITTQRVGQLRDEALGEMREERPR
ncbi:sigma-70 family RNA polymerase sigma factor [Pseudonocardia sp. TRM90224]|uniref:sigma-70 family RNA polymerase sigma factor n=1 Tax=Pseudonocardia sp. TRM90224 TaxID=2812678 RepID=UPI001E32A9A3|nr:sigma-70 family RNA polymerase sigma factor [Pseudonocardia sp. TRM90224]